MADPAGQCLPYACSVGYAMFNGTSMASPQAAGAAALLVSAAKAAGYQHQPDQLRQAMNSSARFIENYQAYEQGNGLIRVSPGVGPAEDQRQDGRHLVIGGGEHGAVRVPRDPGRRHRHLRPRGRQGRDSYTRTYTLTRTNGGGGTKTYAVSWVGNDGTFESARR